MTSRTPGFVRDAELWRLVEEADAAAEAVVLADELLEPRLATEGVVERSVEVVEGGPERIDGGAASSGARPGKRLAATRSDGTFASSKFDHTTAPAASREGHFVNNTITTPSLTTTCLSWHRWRSS